MERSSKQVWIVRLLALLIMSVVFAILTIFAQNKTGSFDYKIEVRANDTEKIVKAVENLGISDIYIKTRETSWYERNPNTFKYTIGAFLTLGLFLGVYYAIYCLVNAILFRPKKDESLLTQP